MAREAVEAVVQPLPKIFIKLILCVSFCLGSLLVWNDLRGTRVRAARLNRSDLKSRADKSVAIPAYK